MEFFLVCIVKKQLYQWHRGFWIIYLQWAENSVWLATLMLHNNNHDQQFIQCYQDDGFRKEAVPSITDNRQKKGSNINHSFYSKVRCPSTVLHQVLCPSISYHRGRPHACIIFPALFPVSSFCCMSSQCPLCMNHSLPIHSNFKSYGKKKAGKSASV